MSATPLADLAALRARAVRQERELQETREQMARVTNQVQALSADLARGRAYAFDARAPLAEVVEGCAGALARYGFTVLEHVIPAAQVAAVREEVVAAESIIERNLAAISYGCRATPDILRTRWSRRWRGACSTTISASPSSICRLSTPIGPTAPPADSALPGAAGATSANGIRTGPTI